MKPIQKIIKYNTVVHIKVHVVTVMNVITVHVAVMYVIIMLRILLTHRRAFAF